MTFSDLFPSTLDEAWRRIAAVHPIDYARTRNELDGAVTRLSPYITHGFVSVPEILAAVAARHPLYPQHKFVLELAWREYFQHVWQHRGDDILQSLHPSLLPDSAYTDEMPADIREARTGVPVIDQAVRMLYATGYLHNHARLWSASYVVHLRKVHWRAGADWLLAHLLDGDLASNHLSWQWVAGTGSSKPYLFNAENVARFAPPEWHSAGSVIDTSYEELDAMARSVRPVAVRALSDGVSEPTWYSRPPVLETGPEHLEYESLTDRDVWLVHPWALGEPSANLPAGCVTVGWWPADYYDVRPWAGKRWEFVSARMSALTSLQWYCTTQQFEHTLRAARSVQTSRNPHVSALMPPFVQQHEPVRLFGEVDRPYASFSKWWKRVTRGIEQLSNLPGLMALAEPGARGAKGM